jgi:hypothetical protein
MRSIPPKNVVSHHLPFSLGMAPTCWLSYYHAADFQHILEMVPETNLYCGAGCLTSGNEALWVASSFFPASWLDSKIYRVGQKVFAFTALTQFLLVGGYGAFFSLLRHSSIVFAAVEDHYTVARTCVIIPCIAFFLIIPFVQIPLLRGAFSRLVDAIQDKDRPLTKPIEMAVPDTDKKTHGKRSKKAQ